MIKHSITLILAVLFTPLCVLAEGLISDSHPDAEIYFIQPNDGQIVPDNVTVVFGLKNMGVAPAGTVRKNTGHHHLLIDTDELPDLTKPLPATDKIKHFGGGQTETTITLAPGKHTLQLLLGNHAHVPHSKPVISEKISILVK
jgi:hypothetical protein